MQSSLALNKTHYETQVALFLGWALDASGWNSTQTLLIQSQQGYVASGVRRFYKPYPFWPWSFLKPYKSLTLASGTTTVQLPGDFSGIEGEITISDANSGAFLPVEMFNATYIDQRFAALPSITGRPQMAALRALKGTSPSRSSIQELYFFPTADQNYTVKFCYHLIPDLLDGMHPYVYGGAEHSETILEACLAVAEERCDDMPQGVHAIAFQRELMSSIDKDRQKKPQWFGRNRDRSDDTTYQTPIYEDWPAAQVNGTVYS